MILSFKAFISGIDCSGVQDRLIKMPCSVKIFFFSLHKFVSSSYFLCLQTPIADVGALQSVAIIKIYSYFSTLHSTTNCTLVLHRTL